MKLYAILTMLTVALAATCGETVWYDGISPVSYCLESAHDPVVATALDMFSSDMEAVTGMKAVPAPRREGCVSIVQLDRCDRPLREQLRSSGINVDSLSEMHDGFSLTAVDGIVSIVGANGRGTAYGILELSRMAGVSPWIWWGDLPPERRNRLAVPDTTHMLCGASVEYRGVFVNDEDWSLRPWSTVTHSALSEGQISTATYRELFRLLMRLRGNALWPGMHEGTKAFFRTPGAKEAADSCGIAIGSSHCEPMLRNNVGEWDAVVRGPYNYITNAPSVISYWAERLDRVRGSSGGNILTIGMRGIHDGSMEGVRTIDEKHRALQQVIDDQQQLIADRLGDPARQMQVFVPYKEVLGIYERGLEVPEYVTLLWCDDNYGYLTRLSDEAEQNRCGGAGVYYHLSYWGRPHDYLWLSTTQPGLICNELNEAYDHNMRRLWIANIHDPKVAGYQLELFLDLAWNIGSVRTGNVGQHYREWLCRHFGDEAGMTLYPAMREFYRLCGERKPEFMGWNQTELDKRLYHRGLGPVADTGFSDLAFGGETDRYMAAFSMVEETVDSVAATLPPHLADAYFAAVEYPVKCASAQAVKMLEAQRARQAVAGRAPLNPAEMRAEAARHCALSQDAYQRIRSLTARYNDSIAGGKWKNLMSMSPRGLPVFDAPALPLLLSEAETSAILAQLPPRLTPAMETDGVVARDAAQYDGASTGAAAIDMLGHSMCAVKVPEGGSLWYAFSTDTVADAVLYTALIPKQPAHGGDLRYSIRVDSREPVVISLKEPFRSERWKLNVLRGQALRAVTLAGLAAGQHTLEIKALDPGIILDQWMVDTNPGRRFYLIPTNQ